jgi:hypothetical protein
MEEDPWEDDPQENDTSSSSQPLPDVSDMTFMVKIIHIAFQEWRLDHYMQDKSTASNREAEVARLLNTVVLKETKDFMLYLAQAQSVFGTLETGHPTQVATESSGQSESQDGSKKVPKK